MFGRPTIETQEASSARNSRAWIGRRVRTDEEIWGGRPALDYEFKFRNDITFSSTTLGDMGYILFSMVISP